MTSAGPTLRARRAGPSGSADTEHRVELEPRSPASRRPGPPSRRRPGTRTYRIKAGDTLIGIAAKFNTTPKAIAKLNGLSNPSALKVGQVLQIP